MSEVKHGKIYAYQRGCRCDECRAANAARCRRNVASRRRRRGQEDFSHGASGYTNWGCRCQTCVAANTQAGRANKASFESRHRANDGTHRTGGYQRDNQAVTTDSAVRHRLEWTGPELELAARVNLTATQVALMTGRTFRAVKAMRRKLIHEPRIRTLAGIGS